MPPKLIPVDFDPFSRDDNQLAKAGINGDTKIVHVTPGDIIIPAERRNQVVDSYINQITGGQLGRFTVAHPDNSLNPTTGLAQFEDLGGEGTESTAGEAASGGGPGGGSSSAGDGFETLGGAGFELGTGGVVESTGPGGSNNPVEVGIAPGGITGLGPGLDPEIDPAFDAGMSGITPAAKTGFFDDPFGSIAHAVVGRVQDAINNPIATAIDFGIGKVPGLGLANSLSGLISGGDWTIGRGVTAAGRAIFGGDNSVSTTAADTGSNPSGTDSGRDISRGDVAGTSFSVQDAMGNAAVNARNPSSVSARPPIYSQGGTPSTAGVYTGKDPQARGIAVADIMAGFNVQTSAYERMLQSMLK